MPIVEFDSEDEVDKVQYALFDLARAKLGYENKHGTMTPAIFHMFFDCWHELALDAKTLDPRKSKEEYFMGFKAAAMKAHTPKGEYPQLTIAWNLALSEPQPEEANRYKTPDMRILVAWCFQIHKLSGNGIWFLPSRVAGQFLNRDHKTICHWILAMEYDGILRRVEQAAENKKRNPYRCPRYQFISQ